MPNDLNHVYFYVNEENGPTIDVYRDPSLRQAMIDHPTWLLLGSRPARRDRWFSVRDETDRVIDPRGLRLTEYDRIYFQNLYGITIGRPRRGRPPKIESEETPVFDPTTCECKVCKYNRREGIGLDASVVHEYSQEPRGGWIGRKVIGDPFDYFIGVELETDRTKKGRYGDIESSISNEEAAAMRSPTNLWLAKRDGSVTGPEFASQPATLTYWHRHRAKIETMFADLLHAGFRSYENDKCGMHINISRTAFADSKHLYRFLTLIHTNESWAMRMSQRTMESIGHWANMSVMRDATDRKDIADRVRPRFGGRGITDMGATEKYTSVNIPSYQPRIEFRMPRGTLRIDRFFKNIEWTVAMVEYTRTAKTVELRVPQFNKWVMQRMDEYPDLAEYLIEKKMPGAIPASI